MEIAIVTGVIGRLLRELSAGGWRPQELMGPQPAGWTSRRVSVAALEATKAPVRGQYQLAMAALAEPLTAPTVRPREVLRRLDIVGLRSSDADRLATAASKRRT